MKGDRAAAIRDGKVTLIAADDLQVGDLVLIQAGDMVPADLRLLEAMDLEVDEFDMTGEMNPVPKRLDSGGEVRVFQGTRVLRGYGKGMVIATGEETEYGKIGKVSQAFRKREEDRRIPKRRFILLLLLLPALGVRLKFAPDHGSIYVVYPLLAFLLLLLQNPQWLKRFLLRRFQAKLDKDRIWIRTPEVLEEMQGIDVFCFDKTGVLTSRIIRVKEIFLGGERSPIDEIKNRPIGDLILTGCALCHDHTILQTMALMNPLDRALIAFAEAQGISLEELPRQYQRIDHQPFHSEKRHMTCGFREISSGRLISFAKGDPEVILRKCRRYLTSEGQPRSLDGGFLSALRMKMEEMSQDGSILIAMAFCENGPPPSSPHYTFLCLFRLENPLQPEAQAVVRELNRRGFRNVILTGDRVETALRVGADVGIEKAENFYLTGRVMETMPLSELGRQCEYVSIFSRLSPSQKGTIVRLLQQRGHRVAVVGDGTNDVIALKAADVGISFFAQSSPLAKRAAQVLIGNLNALLELLDGVRFARRRIQGLTIALAVLFFLFLGVDFFLSL